MPPQRHRSQRNPRARHAIGRAAEGLAARYLQRQGCTIVARRFGKRGGEIDLVVDDGGVVAFVEVKARRGERYGAPVSAVTARKRRRIVATARAFLAARRWRSRRCRFDIVGVRLGQGRAQVAWYRDAFRP
ncbi:MAG: YraN family protein [Acidobacteriota bacterium]|jgi:putative endonuclease